LTAQVVQNDSQKPR